MDKIRGLFDRLENACFSAEAQPSVHVYWPIRIVLALLGGVCVFLAYPNFDQFYLAYVALALELWAIEGLGPKGAFFLGWLAGSVTNIGGFYWVASLLEVFGHMPAWLSMLLCCGLGMIQGLVFALWAWGIKRIDAKHIWVAGVALFVAIEMFFPMLFPWYYGNSQYNFIPAVQTADIFGVLGVSMLVVVVNILLYDVSRVFVMRRLGLRVRVNSKLWRLAVAYVVICFVYGGLRIAQIDRINALSPHLEVGLVEADVGTWENESPEKLRNNLFTTQTLSRELDRQGVDLIVWPESAYQVAYIWGSTRTFDRELDYEIDAMYSDWFVPTARLVYDLIDRSFGEDFHRNPAIYTSLMQAMSTAGEEHGLVSLERMYPALIGGFSINCSEEKPNFMRCPYERLAADGLTYYLPSTEPLRDSRRSDLLKMIRPEDILSPIRGFDAAVMFGTLTLNAPGVTTKRFAELYRMDSSRRQLYNTAHFVDNKGHILGSYHKNYLLMFGEYIPLASKFPWIYEVLPEAGNLTAGDEIDLWHYKGFDFAPIICYEDILPRYVNKYSELKPNVFVNMTNDAWFGKTAEPKLHLALAMMRTVEHRKWLIRSTNTGISAFVDPNGRLVKHTSIEDAEVLRQSVGMMPKTRTVYSYIGDLLGYVAAAWVLLLGVVARRRRKRAAASSSAEGDTAETASTASGSAEGDTAETTSTASGSAE
ncbi:MAG: apolipoprotein N-acyltransferase, partial [Proteobacteria bacterium]|nr:apolipoprotein N-acyltransferase [Pseudomonadota bacterium]